MEKQASHDATRRSKHAALVPVPVPPPARRHLIAATLLLPVKLAGDGQGGEKKKKCDLFLLFFFCPFFPSSEWISLIGLNGAHLVL